MMKAKLKDKGLELSIPGRSEQIATIWLMLV